MVRWRDNNRATAMKLADLKTPALILDRTRLEANIARMQARAKALGVDLRPHMKTAKSAQVAAMATRGFSGGITVSTLAEADYFLKNGFKDMTYAVGIVPGKLDEVAALQGRGATVSIITDDVGVAGAIAQRAKALGTRFRVLIEVDTGGGRAGVAPDSPDLVAIAAALKAPGVELAGVLTHAGHSYACETIGDIIEIAEEERAGAVRAAERLRAAGHSSPVVSVGSTPTALFAKHLEGVTEMRPGNFVFFDLFQAALGSCSEADVAVSVLASVTGHHRGRNHMLLDAGALALSKDTGANARRPGTGYGAVCEPAAVLPEPGLAVLDVHQEHGIVGCAKALDAIEPFPFQRFPVGSRVRVLPNHVCMTAAMYERYYITDGGDAVLDTWDRVNGW